MSWSGTNMSQELVKLSYGIFIYKWCPSGVNDLQLIRLFVCGEGESVTCYCDGKAGGYHGLRRHNKRVVIYLFISNLTLFAGNKYWQR